MSRPSGPALQDALEYLREGDTLVVWRLDRLGRSLKDLVQKVEELQNSQHWFSQPAGKHRHDQPQRQVPVPCLFGAGRV